MKFQSLVSVAEVTGLSLALLDILKTDFISIYCCYHCFAEEETADCFTSLCYCYQCSCVSSHGAES